MTDHAMPSRSESGGDLRSASLPDLSPRSGAGWPAFDGSSPYFGDALPRVGGAELGIS